ncbi:hypothetical protein L0Y49_03260, partial [bacterium]|nr:hypothetical protein [bacterium]
LDLVRVDDWRGDRRERGVAVADGFRPVSVPQSVIAELDGGWTMKYLRKKGNQTYLEPANKRLKNMYPKEGLHVAAIVKAVVRKY